MRTIADRFGPSKTALLRHRGHLPKTLAVAKQAEKVASADSLLDKVGALLEDAQRLCKKAEAAEDTRTALAGVREVGRVLELLGRLRGELASGANVTFLVGKLPDEAIEGEWQRRFPGTILPRQPPERFEDLVAELNAMRAPRAGSEALLPGEHRRIRGTTEEPAPQPRSAPNAFGGYREDPVAPGELGHPNPRPEDGDGPEGTYPLVYAIESCRRGAPIDWRAIPETLHAGARATLAAQHLTETPRQSSAPAPTRPLPTSR
ncbi:MAG TPA: hypothetical protein VMB50_24820 [Myxococcales bacterium]|nr:hypothetical protein [Myxococcales bacterium]